MTDALSEALLKLSAAKPVSDRKAPVAEAAAAAGAAAGDPEKVVSAEASGRSVTTLQTAAAVIAEATPAPAESAAVCGTAVDRPSVGLGPSYGASPGPVSAPGAIPADAGATSAGWMVRVRELRGWVAAGIALALLFTVVDDLRNRGATRSGAMAAGSGSEVNLDELLKEFETAEPASRPERNAVVETETLPDTVSEVTANYGDGEMAAEEEPSASRAGARVVRFAGRIEPLR